MASDKISSRLLTMKFMQRGILNSPNASPSHQRGSGSGSSTPSSKRQRLSSDGASKSRRSDADMEAALHTAIADEEAKRQELMERVAADTGDTRWVLSVQRPQRQQKADVVYNVAVAGFADIDEGGGEGSETGEEGENEEDYGHKTLGRRTYGQVTSSIKAGAGNDESADDSEGDYDPSSIDAMIAEAQSATRGNQSLSMNGDRMPTSISGGGGSLSNRSTPRKSFNCYQCGKEGHIAKLCPNR